MITIADAIRLAPAFFVLVPLCVVLAFIFIAVRTAPQVTFVNAEPPQFLITHKGRASILIDARSGERHELGVDAQCHPLSITAHGPTPLVFFSLPADHNLARHSHRYAVDDFLTDTLRAFDPLTRETITLPSPQLIDGKFAGLYRLTDAAVAHDKTFFVALAHRRDDPNRLDLPLRSLVVFTRDDKPHIFDIGKSDRYFFDYKSRVLVPYSTHRSADGGCSTLIKIYHHETRQHRDVQIPGLFIAASNDLRRAAMLTLHGQGGEQTSAINIIDLDSLTELSRITSAQAPAITEVASTLNETRSPAEQNAAAQTAVDFHLATGRRCTIDASLTKLHWLQWNAQSNIPAVRLIAIDLRTGVQETILDVDKIPQPKHQPRAADAFEEAARQAVGNRACSIAASPHSQLLTLTIFFERYRVDPAARTIERFRLPSSDDNRGDTVIQPQSHDGNSLLAKTNLRLAMNDVNRAAFIPQSEGGLFLCRPGADPLRIGGNDCDAHFLGDGSFAVHNQKQAAIVQPDGTRRTVHGEQPSAATNVIF